MKQPVTISTEQLSYENMTDREKAIYDQSHSKGYTEGHRDGLREMGLFAVLIIIAFYMLTIIF